MFSSNHSKYFTSIKMTILSLLAVGLLTGCGIQGSLKPPPPIFGGDAQVDPNQASDGDLDNQNTGSLEDLDDDLLEDF